MKESLKKEMKKPLLFILLIFVFTVFYGQISTPIGLPVSLPLDIGLQSDFLWEQDTAKWYFSNSGNDSWNGHTSVTPKKTISELNGLTLEAGDAVLFNRGDTWNEQIVVFHSGGDGNPITYSSYGTGADPIITGFTTVTGWTDELDGTFSKEITVSSDSQTNMVVIDDVHTGMGRYPDAAYLTYESHSTNVSITDNGLGDDPDWAGAEVVIRKNDYMLDRCFITDHNGDVITYTTPPTAPLDGTDNYGYFIQNDLRTVTAINEWYHDTVSEASTFYIYGDPAAKVVKVATLDYLVYIDNQNYITIDGISFVGAIAAGIYNHLGDDCIIQNCDISFTGVDGIYNYYGHDVLVDANTVSNTSRAGIRNNGGNGATIVNNTILKAGIIKGAAVEGYLSDGVLQGGGGEDALVQYNNIDSCGYHGIGLGGDRAEARNNFTNHSGLILADVGGIYTSSAYTDRVIDGNIVLNVIGNLDGAANTSTNACGIYLDLLADAVMVTDNTIAYCTGYGIQINQTADHTVTGNTIFDNKQALGVTEYQSADIDGYTVDNNILFAKGPYQHSFFAYVPIAIYPDFATFDTNYYARPIDDDDVMYFRDINTNDLDSLTIAEWQGVTGQDAESQGAATSVTDTSEIDFYYNATKVNKEITLSAGTFFDVEGTEYSGSATLLPFTSIILMEEQ